MRMEGISVVVSGGSRGIGAACVRSLAAAGARVTLTYRSSPEAAQQLVAECGPARVNAVRCDVASPGDCEAAIRASVERFGALDVLVNNAGIFAENPFDGGDYDAWRAGWQRTFDVNVFGAANLTWLALRHMRRNVARANGTRGRVINVTSRAAHRGETTFADYGASKAALGNFTRSLARGCANDGIVAFAVAPGFIETDMAAEALEQSRARLEAEVPSGRIGMPDDISGIITFLANGGADYATGSTIDLNGASYVR